MVPKQPSHNVNISITEYELSSEVGRPQDIVASTETETLMERIESRVHASEDAPDIEENAGIATCWRG